MRILIREGVDAPVSWVIGSLLAFNLAQIGGDTL